MIRSCLPKINCPPVALVGAGPGDPGLFTLCGLELLQAADCVVYDRLIPESLLELARPDAEKIYVGKAAGAHSMSQDEINQILIEKARAGQSVVRLKGGDPFVFGRGGEEATFCRQNGVPFQIVPGVSSAIAAPAYAGIPVTHRDVAASFAVVTGHTASDDAPPELLPVADTLVFLMSLNALPQIVAQLRERGDSKTKPVAVISQGTTRKQEVVVGTLETIENQVEKAKLETPALIVVGEVVKLRANLNWFENQMLADKTVIVTRAREQASGLVKDLENLGAKVVQCPTIRVEEPENYQKLDAALAAPLSKFDWVVFTSTNGVAAFWRRLKHFELDSRVFGAAKIAAIGPATAAALETHGIRPDFVPESSISEKVAEGLIHLGVARAKILVVRATESREVLETQLSQAGAKVTVAPVYRTVSDNSKVAESREKIERGEVDWVTFTSSSTVKNFVDAMGAEFLQAQRRKFKVAVIGPITAQSARDAGLMPDVTADQARVDVLASALAAMSKGKK